LQAEERWQVAFEETGLPVHILRLAGIYGPGRSAIDAASDRRSRSSDDSSNKARRARQKYQSRVHVGDICRAVEASMRSPRPGAIYNIVDDEPAGRAEVVAFARRLLQGVAPVSPASKPVSNLEPMRKDEGRRGRLAEPLEEKRVRNELIKEELGVELAVPSYREGLAAINAGELWPFRDENDLRCALL
jgi:nucleoside-diphosphate-sugar epimerase